MTKKIQEEICIWLVKNGAEAVCENYDLYGGWEMDVASLSKSNLLTEYEVKISRQDFLNDKRKKSKKFLCYGGGTNVAGRVAPNFFYYICPHGLIKEKEIPEWAGLIYYENGKLKWIKSPKKLHKVKADKDRIFSKMLRLTIQRKYLGCSMMTYLNKKIREKNAERLKCDLNGSTL